MAHLHPLVRAIPLAMALALLPACERQDVNGDPRVDGITQTPMSDPDLSILGDQKTRTPARGGTPTAAPRTSTPAGATTASTTSATTTAGPEAVPTTAPADIPAPPTQPAAATPPAPPIPG